MSIMATFSCPKQLPVWKAKDVICFRTCNKPCRRPEGCRLHFKPEVQYSNCPKCNKVTHSKSGYCHAHSQVIYNREAKERKKQLAKQEAARALAESNAYIDSVLSLFEAPLEDELFLPDSPR